MKNDDALISTAVLTAIWDESHKDNIELITPFVISIIGNLYKIKDELNLEEIVERMRCDYCFNNFPLAILKVVLSRLKKKGILLLNSKKYYLVKDVSDDINKFDIKRTNVRSEVSATINEIKKYLEENMNKKISIPETEKYFSNFISSYGYNTHENINSIKTIDRKIDFTNYLIGEFICNEEKNNSEVFKCVLKIIEGYMIANAIYLQIENDNKATLSNLNCYLDSSFVLRIFGYKTDEENKSAKELYELLKKYGARLKCFKHTYNEVYNILTYYKNNIGKSKTNTLEYLDKEKYTEGQVDLILSSLENRFKEFKIEIIDKPSFVDNERYMIDYKNLEKKLLEHKKNTNSYYTESTIQNDCDSVASISILRKGFVSNKIENCKYIFLTGYKYLKVASREVATELNETNIGLVIDDLDLTTILWFKDFKNNSDLPKMRLIENALTATTASDAIIEKAIPIFESIKRDNLLHDLSDVSDCLTKHYLKVSGYLEEVKNDLDKVSKKSFVEFLSKKDAQIEEYQKEVTKLKKDNKTKEDKIKSKLIKQTEIELENKYDLIIKVSHYMYVLIFTLFTFYCIWLTITTGMINKSLFESIILYAFNIIGYIDLFSPRLKLVFKFIDRFIKNFKRDELKKKIDKITNTLSEEK